MSTLNQLISEISHSVQQSDSVPVRRAIRQGLIHARNEAIRQSIANNRFADKVLFQRLKVKLTSVPDGDLENSSGIGIDNIKRSANKLPKPTRVNNGIPFHTVKTVGVNNPIIVPFIKEGSFTFYNHLPGMNQTVGYDYINGYLYLFDLTNRRFQGVGNAIIESIFEHPFLVKTETVDGSVDIDDVDDDDEFLIPEDMINTVKKLFLETFNPQVIRQTNEIPTPNLVK